MLAPEHADGLWGSSDDQAASFGTIVRHALMVVREESDSERGVALVGDDPHEAVAFADEVRALSS